MLVLHANWTDGALRLWAESLAMFGPGDGDALDHVEPSAISGERGGAVTAQRTGTRCRHPFAVPPARLADVIRGRCPRAEAALSAAPAGGSLVLRLPADERGPRPSDRLAAAAGVLESRSPLELIECEVPALTLEPAHTLRVLLSLDAGEPNGTLEFGHALRYWFRVSRFLTELLVSQRFIPTLVQSLEAGLRARWLPWLHDEAARRQAGWLVEAMPPVVRATVDAHRGRPWSILSEALDTLADGTVRAALLREDYVEAIDGRDPAEDDHVAWLEGLLDSTSRVRLAEIRVPELLRAVGDWVSRLDETGDDQGLRLCLRLNEPDGVGDLDAEQAGGPPAETARWRLSFHLGRPGDTAHLLDAEQIWASAGSAAVRGGPLQVERPQELLLRELARAGRVYPRVEAALSDAAPTGVDLSGEAASEFLAEYRPLLIESGVLVAAPDWWDSPTSQLGLRLQVNQDGPGAVSDSGERLGLNSLVHFRWQVAVGEQPLTDAEFEALVRQAAPLVRVRGRWVRLRRDQVAAARRFLEEGPEGRMTLLEAIQVSHGLHGRGPGLPVFGMDASGWVRDLLEATADQERMPMVTPPRLFRGELRPYQLAGLSWLAFLDRFGLGACLADDMGLGKTIQLIALLQHEREQDRAPESIGPTLLLVPTSLIGNWTRELFRFAPELPVHVHHGPERPMGDPFVETATASAVVISTYGLVSRDHATLARVPWHRVVLDEAQYIKNPPTKQTIAIRSLEVARRVALTGTPVENRLSELWSIMEFCNPGYLGAAGEFRRRFAVPIERHRDQHRMRALRRLVLPFVLRRLKTDPDVISDLPPCVETREYATLTPEQAAAYEHVVGRMLRQVDQAAGMQRRGLVLSTLVRLKQICDHPALLDDADQPAPAGASPARRSGKASRLVSMLEEVLAAGERALVFTQFRRMGHLLSSMIMHELDCGVLFLHGGTPMKRRQEMIDRFQEARPGAEVFVLSLKAGGVGLNLTAATHVFHYDRWWNPAVENQATDRAFRIGQTRTVHVHKFVCVGTLEERIDQMIEQKTELARHVIGSGEGWLTELSTGQLRDLLALRQSAMEGEA